VTEGTLTLEVATEHLEPDAAVVRDVAVHVGRRVEEQRLDDEREQQRERDEHVRRDPFAVGLGFGAGLDRVGGSYQGLALYTSGCPDHAFALSEIDVTQALGPASGWPVARSFT
jgi:hypothetical protein